MRRRNLPNDEIVFYGIFGVGGTHFMQLAMLAALTIRVFGDEARIMFHPAIFGIAAILIGTIVALRIHRLASQSYEPKDENRDSPVLFDIYGISTLILFIATMMWFVKGV